MPKYNPPPKFDFTKPSLWPEWREQFLTFRIATKLKNDEGTVQVHSLLYAMGPEATKIYKKFVWPEPAEGAAPPAIPHNENFDDVLKQFDDYFVPKKNIFHERARFYARNQQKGESVESFLRAINDLSLTCNFTEPDEQIRDRLVLGLQDQEVSRKLQLEDTPPTLADAINTARHYELVNSHIQSNAASSDIDNLHYSSSRSRGNPRGRGGRGMSSARGRSKGRGNHMHATQNNFSDCGNCVNCGKQHQQGLGCPAKGRRCRACGKYNHFESVCMSSRRGGVRRGGHNRRRGRGLSEVQFYQCDYEDQYEDQYEDSVEQEEPFFNLDSVGGAYEPVWREQIVLGNTRMTFKLDCGADLTVISKQAYRQNFSDIPLKPPTVSLRSVGEPLKCLGHFSTTAHHRDKSCHVDVYVADHETEGLLGRPALVSLDLVKRVDPVNQKDPIFGNLDKNPIKTQPVKIVLKENAEPYSVPVARRVPLPLLGKVKAELDRLQACGVIEKIEEATDWCAPIVPVLKKNGNVRLTTDFKHLNKSVKRERYILPSIEDITHRLAGSTIFTKLDATSAFFQLPLDPGSAKLTTFITPCGRYFYKRLPQGITSAPEIFQKTLENLLEEHRDTTICFFDDILVHSKNDSEHEQHVQETMNTLRDANVKLEQEKCEFGKKEVNFLGFKVSKDGLRPDPEKVKAIVEMPAPKDVPELRRFLGMTNFLGRHLENLSSILHPLNSLLEKDAVWQWGPQQREAFQQVKTLLTTAPTLAFYDPSLPTTVSADASSYGLGAVLLQLHDGVQRPVAYCSRSLTRAEQNYAQIEKELLASVWACEKFSRYLIGLDFTLLTDHKPLIPLINTKDLSEIPIRCQRLMIRLNRFAPTALHVPGKEMYVPDTLSRCPIPAAEAEVQISETAVDDYVRQITSSWPVSDKFLQKVKEESEKDMSIKVAMDFTIKGWPSYCEDVPLAARDFYAFRSDLSVVEGLLTYGDRIVIPHSLRKKVLDIIHQGHQGITKCRERARTTVWWPRMGKEIQSLVSSCAICLQKQPSHSREPMKPSTPPDRPFQRVATDILEFQRTHYLVLVDSYSRYLEISQLSNLTSAHVISKMKTVFARHGVPETVISDNGTQFTSAEFRDFADKWNFDHQTSSPHYPVSNGQAESAVKIAKSILSQEDPALALLVYRSTPLPNLSSSPAELAFGRKIRSNLPTLPKTLKPRLVSPEDVFARDTAAKEKQKLHYDRRHGVRPLTPLKPGDSVLVKTDEEKKWGNRAEIVSNTTAPRSYIIKRPDGTQMRRNRKHLLLFPNAPLTPVHADHHPSGSIIRPAASPTRTSSSPRPTPVIPPSTPMVPPAPTTPRRAPPPEPPPTHNITSHNSNTLPIHITHHALPTPPVKQTRCGRQINPPARFR